ncbi:hypothetical protein M413DRAFT_28087 [Hebeloma cylindrosporum]|uniref:BTB domain-containing protein n=1 Tax=Hebeloma cylindrosporum TaxID=76867 RepID=A0A0C2YIV0_HEBCY|nr:hypothetical protein M413DRAFT_28087 [Hebeloma cylindrosporum h7]
MQYSATKASTSSATSQTDVSSMGYVRDEEFWFKKGDCVVIVENTMLKIHLSDLERDGSVFADMFSLPNGDDSPNTTTEADPLILPDKLHEFRALCWMLYASPLELEEQHNPALFKFSTVFHLLSICHKYHFETYEKWAGRLLIKHCAHDKGKDTYLDNQPFSELENMLRISVRINLYQFTDAIERSVLRKLQERPSLSVANALNLAEELGLRRFQGRLYYHEFTRQPVLRIKSSTAYAFPPGDLTPAQTMALLRGSFSLSEYWMNLPSVIQYIKVPQTRSCAKKGNSHADCQAHWEAYWSPQSLKQVLTTPSFSFGTFEPGVSRPRHPGPLEGLDTLQDSFRLAPTISVPFSRLGLSCCRRAISMLIEQLHDTLADHFLGPLTDNE